MSKKTVSYLISGRGSNFSSLAQKIRNGDIHARNGVVISSRSDAEGIERAISLAIPVFVVERKNFSDKELFEKELLRILREHKTDLVVTAGFMILLSPYFIRQFSEKIINIHPSLLPAFPGKNAQQQALDHGVKISGCTCHFIDEGTDTGPIIMQTAVPVEEGDDITSLSKKILLEEHRILGISVGLFCENRLIIHGRKVIVKNKSFPLKLFP